MAVVKALNIDSHVAVLRNINNVVVNNPETPVNKGFARTFNLYE